jgi:hypothetical protein
MGSVPAFASADEAMAMVHAGLGYLAAADATAMAAGEQARLLRGLERGDAIGTAARASVLGAFTAGQVYAADGAYNARAWLIHQTGITRGAGGRAGLGVLRAGDLPVDGQAARRLPGCGR